MSLQWESKDGDKIKLEDDIIYMHYDHALGHNRPGWSPASIKRAIELLIERILVFDNVANAMAQDDCIEWGVKNE